MKTLYFFIFLSLLFIISKGQNSNNNNNNSNNNNNNNNNKNNKNSNSDNSSGSDSDSEIIITPASSSLVSLQCSEFCGEYNNGICNSSSGSIGCECFEFWFGGDCNLSPTYFRQNVSSNYMNYFYSISNHIYYYISEIEEIDNQGTRVKNFTIGKDYQWMFYNGTVLNEIQRYIYSASIGETSNLKLDISYLYSQDKTTVKSDLNPNDHIPILKTTIKYSFELQDYILETPSNTLKIHFRVDNNVSAFSFSKETTQPNHNNSLFLSYIEPNSQYGVLFQIPSRKPSNTLYPIDIVDCSIDISILDFTILPTPSPHSIINNFTFSLEISNQYNDSQRFDIYISYLNKYPSVYFNVTPSPCEYVECAQPTQRPSPTTNTLPNFVFGNSSKLHIPTIHLYIFIIIILLSHYLQ